MRARAPPRRARAALRRLPAHAPRLPPRVATAVGRSFKSQAKPIGGVRIGALETSTQAATAAVSLQDRKNYAGKALGSNASEWARTTASFGRIVGDAPWHGDGFPPGEEGARIRRAAAADTRPIVMRALERERLECARANRPAQARGNVHGYAPPM